MFFVSSLDCLKHVLFFIDDAVDRERVDLEVQRAQSSEADFGDIFEIRGYAHS